MKTHTRDTKGNSSLGRGASSFVRAIGGRRGKRSASILLLLCLLFIFAFDPIAAPQIEATIISINEPQDSIAQTGVLTEVNSTEFSVLDSALTVNLNRSPSDLTTNTFQSNFVTTDPRNIAMRQFLEDHNSPMYPYAEVFVEKADEFDLDWRLVAAISGVESGFGNIVPRGSNNAWGWRGARVNGRSDWSRFTSWSHGISVVTERLAKGYGTDITPFQMEAAYCPPCAQNPRHEWANGVNNYMIELNYYMEDL